MSVNVLRNVLLLSGAFLLGLCAQAQQVKAATSRPELDVAITYNAERAKIAGVDCGCFWLQGAGSNAAVTFYHGLGVAADLWGDQSANISDGVSLSKVMFAMGPRYTYSPGKHRITVFGEGLFGLMHGFNGVFPSSSGAQGAASSLGMQFGGGVNLQLTRKIGVRAVEADYVRSTLPNSANNEQNDLRLSAGVNFHFHLPR